MNILHICAGWQKWNGAANIARMIMDEQRREGHEVSFATWAKVRELCSADEVWIHCGWLPCLWWAALWGRNVRWMPEACYDPVRLRFHGWKKCLAGPIERFFLRRAKMLVATCEAEKGWIESYLGRRCPPIELTDIKRFFKLHGEVSTQSRVTAAQAGLAFCSEPSRAERVPRVAEYAESDVRLPSADGGLGQRPRDNSASSSLSALASLGLAASPGVASTHKGRLRINDKNQDEPLHLLYLGRRHPLKGVEYLETAVRQIEKNSAYSASSRLCVKYISSAFGEEKEKVWNWCDVLVLPTLSENFGLVVAEALERGKRVITTDGAPAWGDGNDYGGRLIYLNGYRDGTPEKRVELLLDALKTLCREA